MRCRTWLSAVLLVMANPSRGRIGYRRCLRLNGMLNPSSEGVRLMCGTITLLPTWLRVAISALITRLETPLTIRQVPLASPLAPF